MNTLFSFIASSGEFLIPKPNFYLRDATGTRVRVNATILASASTVLHNMLTSHRIVQIHGVPNDVVLAFVRFIHTSRCSDEDMKNYGIHLLVLSHVYSMPKLKQRCVIGLSQLTTPYNVVDMLHLARVCDAPDFYLMSMKFVINNLKSVKQTDGWKFLHKHDPQLELDIINLIKEQKKRKKIAKRQREEQKLFVLLADAMECLEHIYTEGCTDMVPYDMEIKEHKKPCFKFSTCQGLQGLIKHFAMCKRKQKGGCVRCKRMMELFRLHSCICLHIDSCKVPLCREFQLKMEKENKRGDACWKLLVRKVASVKVMSSLLLSKDKIS